MKNIWQIFRRDVWRIRNNVIALIVIMGLTVVPCLYAWFNIAASWDPYSNTGNLKVAVASTDEGYEGSLIPIQINIGERVLSALHENNQMEWVFTSKKAAIKGVRSGEYYAAIVIPENFSTDMMSLFSDDIEKPEIIYYSNAKENAIAPKVTDKGASAIQNQINEVFIETVSDTLLTVMQSVMNMTDDGSGTDANSLVSNLIMNLENISGSLSTSSDTLKSFSGMTSSIQQLMSSSSDFLNYVKTQSSDDADKLGGMQKTVTDIRKTMNGTTDSINELLDSSKEYYEQISELIDSAFETQSGDAAAVADTLDTVASRVDKVISSYTDTRNSIASIAEKHPELSPLTEPILAKLDASIASQTELSEELKSTAESLRTSASDITTAKKELDKLIDDSIDGIDKLKSEYENNIKSILKKLSASLGDTSGDITELLKHLDESVDNISELTDSAASDLAVIQTALDGSGKLLDKAVSRVDNLVSKLKEMQASGDYSELKDLLVDNKEELSEFLAAPVSLKTHKVYEIENYGSAMAPFYSTLSIWIGGVVLVAMMSVNVSESTLEGLSGVKNRHVYFGRYILFLILGLMQSTLIGLGDLLFLGIQCRHPFLFMLSCWFSSIVYVLIIYTLTVSFGDIGKAISVILLVIQVAGTGGTFPIEVAPLFFRVLYPLLPFTHSMAAMRETVGGLYGMDYWFDLAKLSIFLVLSLIVGLLLRKPIIRLNAKFAEMLEETKVM
jgi:putative membrane protein